MGLEIPLSWRLSVTGADEVKDNIRQINDLYANGVIDVKDYTGALKSETSTLRTLVNQQNINKNLLYAQYPALNLLTRSLSSVAHVSRAVLNITNSLNSARLTGRTITQQEVENNRRLAEIDRELLTNTELTTQEIRALQEEKNGLLRVNKEIKDQRMDQVFSDWLTAISSVTFGISVFGKEVLKLIPKLKELRIAHLALAPAVWASAGPYGLIAGGIAAVGFAIYELIKVFQDGEVAWAVSVANFFQPMVDMFTVTLPEVFATAIPLVQAGMIGFANVILSVINELGSGLTAGLNAIIKSIESFVNGFIIIYNSIASKLSKLGVNIKTLDVVTLPTVTFKAIPLIEAAKGFEGMVSNPTMFLAGEAGPEYVSVSPRGSSGRVNTQSSGNVVVNVAGSVVMFDKLVNDISNAIKEDLKRRGL